MTTPDNDGRSYVAVAAAVAFLLAAGWFAVKALGGPTTVAVGPSASVPAATPVTTTSSSTTFASSTSVATTSTAEPSTSTTSSTTDPTVESTTTTTVGPDTTTNIGWYVVGVAPGDVLNVRAAPTVNAEIVGILRPNQDEVTVLAMASNPVGGTAWYGVQLPSGTDGFVNSRYLAHPNQWDAGIKASPCTAQTATATATASTPATGDATAIVGLFQFQTATCDRYVIVLGTSDGTTFEAGEVLGGGDVVVTSGKTRVSVSLPATIVDVVPQATNAGFKQALAMTVVPVGQTERLEVRFLHELGRVAGVTVLSNPARIVIDVAEVPIGSGLDFRPVVETGNTILEHPVDQSTDNVGVSGSFTLIGYARWFESQGYATVLTKDGEDPTTIRWSGPSLVASNAGFASVMAPYLPTWGEFIVTADVSPGKYRLFVGDDCMSSIDDTIRPCGVTESFEVLP